MARTVLCVRMPTSASSSWECGVASLKILGKSAHLHSESSPLPPSHQNSPVTFHLLPSSYMYHIQRLQFWLPRVKKQSLRGLQPSSEHFDVSFVWCHLMSQVCSWIHREAGPSCTVMLERTVVQVKQPLYCSSLVLGQVIYWYVAHQCWWSHGMWMEVSVCEYLGTLTPTVMSHAQGHGWPVLSFLAHLLHSWRIVKSLPPYDCHWRGEWERGESSGAFFSSSCFDGHCFPLPPPHAPLQLSLVCAHCGIYCTPHQMMAQFDHVPQLLTLSQMKRTCTYTCIHIYSYMNNHVHSAPQ